MTSIRFLSRCAAVFAGLLMCVVLHQAAHAAAISPMAPAATGRLAKFEPATGCYIGAFIERDFTVLGDIPSFEALTKKKHASYFTYVGYGKPFPAAWVEKVKQQNAAPHIAFEPNNGLDEVIDSDYLRAWARDAARAQCPIFLRFASEMNGPWSWPKYGRSPDLYKEKFRLMARVMKQEAPNVAMLWTPFAQPAHLINEYYPGDEYVDWVGVNIYAVYIHDGNPLRPANQEDPVAFLRFIYDNYASRKPIHISEFAATIRCKGSNLDTSDFAIQKMTRFYDALRAEFPRVKSVNWFCLDTIRSGLANNNYSILEDGRVLATYQQLVSDRHFLSRVYYNPAEWRIAVKKGTTLGANGATLRSGKASDDEILSGSGAVAASLDQPFLRGLKNGDVIKGDLNLRAQLPLTMEPKGLIWQVDGQTVAITNKAPYRVSVPRERIGSGTHTARVIVLTSDAAAQNESPEVTFQINE